MSDLPAITCLCPTYGRFERLRDAVACLLLQDYPARRLMILNDAEQTIWLTPGDRGGGEGIPGITVWNTAARYATLGHKRQALLRAAQTPLVAHWDDDDLYLPWHLSSAVVALTAHPDAACWKPRGAWYAKGPREAFRIAGRRCNTFEGQMVFRRLAAMALEQPAYPPVHSGQAAALLSRFGRARKLCTEGRPVPWTSYVYRWADRAGHISSGKNKPGSAATFAARNRDFGGGQPLIPDTDPIQWARRRLKPQFDLIAHEIERLLGKEESAGPRAALHAAMEGRPRPGVRTNGLAAGLREQPDRGGRPQTATTTQEQG